MRCPACNKKVGERLIGVLVIRCPRCDEDATIYGSPPTEHPARDWREHLGRMVRPR